ncbi:helix-turn-helix transcriptional regulator [Aliihoeflea sp. 2WW]|uniref:helix-turn-helix transcriptional regulator n=1 Tax=Aliihoeflea sp. 2WW TaxID=1381123 RepID=UPI0004669019|nr:helix-turn-helix transcriptional regulator [Aliihoeflea sp. 2WW]
MFDEGPSPQIAADRIEREVSRAFLDVVERGQELAAMMGAKRFAIVFAAYREGRLALQPFLDTSYPGLSALSHALTAPGVSAELQQAVTRAQPTIFSADRELPAHHGQATVPALVSEEASIVLPVHSPCGRRGLVALSGPEMTVEEDRSMRAHLRAFALFRAACQLRAPEPRARHGLSKRDIECLRLTADGLTSEQIAERLGLSVHTANQYVAAAAEKLDAVNRMHAVAKALRAGIIS